MLESSEILWELIDKKRAHIYVCGDGKNMAQDIYRTFVQIIKNYGGKLSDTEAEAYLKDMRTSNRYSEDIWG
jgi:sulfite reductase alpha subunit-like flavoprotein